MSGAGASNVVDALHEATKDLTQGLTTSANKHISTIVEKAKDAENSFTSSDKFKKMVKDTFNQIDYDKNGTLSKTEVYCGVLLLYTQIVAYVSSAVPPCKDHVDDIFDEIDTDKSGDIDQAEFLLLSTVICKKVAAKVTVEAISSFLLAPILATIVVYLLGLFISVPFFVPTFMLGIVRTLRNTVLVAVLLKTVVPKLLPYVFGFLHWDGDHMGSAKVK